MTLLHTAWPTPGNAGQVLGGVVMGELSRTPDADWPQQRLRAPLLDDLLDAARISSGKIELTYTFLTSASNSTMNKHGISGFSQFSAQQQTQAKLAMQSWADVANVTFTEKATGGEVSRHVLRPDLYPIEAVA